MILVPTAPMLFLCAALAPAPDKAGRVADEDPPPAASTASPDRASPDDVPRASVEIDTGDIGDAGPVIRRRLLERSAVVLRERDVLPAEGPDDPRIEIHVWNLDGNEPGYRFRLRVAALDHEEESLCPLCTESELVGDLEARLAIVVGELRTRHTDALGREEPPPAGTSSTRDGPPPNPPNDRSVLPDDRKIGVLGKAGMGVAAAGLAGLVTGIGLAVREPSPKRGDPLHLLDTRPPGYALVGVGTAVTLAGVALVVVDVLRRKRARAHAWSPWSGPRTVGISFSGAF